MKIKKIALVFLAMVVVLSLSFILTRTLTFPRVRCDMPSQSVNMVKDSSLVHIGFTNDKASRASIDVLLVLPEQDDRVVCSHRELEPNCILLDMEVSPDAAGSLPAGEYPARIDAYMSGTDQLCFSRAISLFVWDTYDEYFEKGLNP